MKRLLILCVLVLVGCGNNPDDDGIDSAGKAAASRIDQIAKSSGGDWDKVSQADKDYVLSQVHGGEQSAKMLLLSKSGKLKATPGGKGAQ